MKDNPIIVALDVNSAADARALVKRIGRQSNFYKVGLELFTAAGMDFVRELTAAGKRVFLDLKLYDIGETVKRTVAVVAESGVEFLSIHSVTQVMRAALEGRGASLLNLLAVSVLTSFDQRDVEDLGYSCTLSQLVVERVRQAMECGMDGVIGSPLEARAIRALTGSDMILVTPGVRSAGAAKGDQKRVATPAEAIRNGADYVVIGREITRDADPAKAIQQILEDIQTVTHA
jgi:orotidine-5'-phosphate decarboxylase